jgi:hypothetical protein
MPSVAELTALYGNFMLNPRPGPNVCDVCFNLTDGYARCYACTHCELWLDAVCPISYCVACEQLHHALRGYKRWPDPAAQVVRVELAAALWRFLATHERCIAEAAGTGSFEAVTTVPSGDASRDEEHPLRSIVGDLVTPTRERYARLLRRSPDPAGPRVFSRRKFDTTMEIGGHSVLLIDDTWTTGANAQSAAAALKAAGASRVAALVIGRYLNPEWRENDRRLRGISRPFDWDRCVFCAPDRVRVSR